jgi:CPA1 family monovalent cation:H+ antiporter
LDALTQFVVLLGFSILVAILARRLRAPYTIGLVLVGIVLAVSKVESPAALTHDFIFDVILPPLLFEAALAISWKDLRKDLSPVLVLSTLGTVIAALFVGAAMKLLLGWPFPSALVFGVLIAATDPVAVIAMFKDSHVEGRLRLLVESESLFNDGAAAVLFAIALAYAASGGQGLSALDIVGDLTTTIFGGLAVGLIAIVMAGGTSDHMVETAVTAVAAYGSFLLAERMGASGVLATVGAGLVMGNFGVLRETGDNVLSQKGREFVVGFWEFAAFIANSIVFPLIGASVAVIPFQKLGSGTLAIVVIATLAARALTVYPICFAYKGTQWAIPAPEQHVLWWGGLRGALALALALALPASLPLHDEIVVAAFAVVVFSVVVQGLTMPPLLRMLGFIE